MNENTPGPDPNWVTDELKRKCMELHIEVIGFISDGIKRVKFICPKIPADKDKDLISATIPKDMVPEFEEGPRPSTVALLHLLAGFQSIAGNITNFDMGVDHPHSIRVDIEGNHTDSFVKDLAKYLDAEPFVNEYQIVVNGEMSRYKDKVAGKETCPVKPKQAEEKVGKVISADDITDLKITLGQCNDVDSFLRSL